MTIEALRDQESLVRLSERLLHEARKGETSSQWFKPLADFLYWLRAAKQAEVAELDFQRRLWDENPVASIGQGYVDVSPFINVAENREWLALQLCADFPESAEQRRENISRLNEELRTRLKERCQRTPTLKLFRVLAVVFPQDLTTIASIRHVKELHYAMFGKPGKRPLLCHFDIVDRLESALGPTRDDVLAIAERMALPWLLYENCVLGNVEKPTEIIVDGRKNLTLNPLPAARRRRGMTGITGGFPNLLGILDFVGAGVSREDLTTHIKTILPDYKDNSLAVVINNLIGELDVLGHDGNLYTLTPRGEALLESEDPEELSDWLLTRILGVDAALLFLSEMQITSQQDLLEEIKSCNPGWTSNFGPSKIIVWLKSLGVIKTTNDGLLRLTDLGQSWAARINWEPAKLQDHAPEPAQVPEIEIDLSSSKTIELPLPEIMLKRITEFGKFEDRTIFDLHAGLWSDKRRHFAILTGLSGIGKTLLARAYAHAITLDNDARRQVCVIPVQPGWYDPGALLGYVNPLRPDAYIRTPFLDFILAAGGDTGKPYVVILDEMNLSHPEQYFAPILSAMETGGKIDLHREGEDFDGVPMQLPYPNNLVIIGTVNMDETTNALSDKVLDRAHTMEFWDIDLSTYPRWEGHGLDADVLEQARSLLNSLFKALRPSRMHFGWRTVGEVLGFLRNSPRIDEPERLTESLDSVIHARILPKLRGEASPRFSQTLIDVIDILDQHDLSQSAERVRELQEDLKSSGSARFWR